LPSRESSRFLLGAPPPERSWTWLTSSPSNISMGGRVIELGRCAAVCLQACLVCVIDQHLWCQMDTALPEQRLTRWSVAGRTAWAKLASPQLYLARKDPLAI
jgi:hypothetical protein